MCWLMYSPGSSDSTNKTGKARRSRAVTRKLLNREMRPVIARGDTLHIISTLIRELMYTLPYNKMRDEIRHFSYSPSFICTYTYCFVFGSKRKFGQLRARACSNSPLHCTSFVRTLYVRFICKCHYFNFTLNFRSESHSFFFRKHSVYHLKKNLRWLCSMMRECSRRDR